jgi:hypothetical protein
MKGKVDLVVSSSKAKAVRRLDSLFLRERLDGGEENSDFISQGIQLIR